MSAEPIGILVVDPVLDGMILTASLWVSARMWALEQRPAQQFNEVEHRLERLEGPRAPACSAGPQAPPKEIER